MIVKWSTDYQVNHPEIDKEHQSLFEMLNDFYEGIQNGYSKEKLASLIKGLLEYAQIHFTHEKSTCNLSTFPSLMTTKRSIKLLCKRPMNFMRNTHPAG